MKTRCLWQCGCGWIQENNIDLKDNCVLFCWGCEMEVKPKMIAKIVKGCFNFPYRRHEVEDGGHYEKCPICLRQEKETK